MPIKPLITAISMFLGPAALAEAETRQLFWGDTHLHTAVSTDAAARGNRLGLDEAYRFARGEEVTATSGQTAQLREPLDFLVVADHSDGMGFFGLLADGFVFVFQRQPQRRKRRTRDGPHVTE